MKLRYLFFVALFFMIVSCKKSGSGSLSISVASISNSYVPYGQTLEVILNFTDDGSHPIDTVYMQKTRINTIQAPTINDSFYLTPPSYNGSVKGQLQLDFGYQNFLPSAQPAPQIGNPPQDVNDSLIFKFVVKDVANHVSDTASTGLIVIQRID